MKVHSNDPIYQRQITELSPTNVKFLLFIKSRMGTISFCVNKVAQWIRVIIRNTHTGLTIAKEKSKKKNSENKEGKL